MNFSGSYKYDYSGRKRKAKKPKGEVYVKYKPPPFTPIETQQSSTCLSYAEQRLTEYHQYPSKSDFAGSKGGTKTEPHQYTGDYVIGIATMHKSNAVPVTNSKQATEIADMAR